MIDPKLITGSVVENWERTFSLPTLNTYEIFYGETAKEIWGDVEPYSIEGCEVFRKWCITNKIYYWAAPREDFFTWKAVEDAQREMPNAKYIILEDLS